MLTILATSALIHLRTNHNPTLAGNTPHSQTRLHALIHAAASAELLLAVLAFTTYHVQNCYTWKKR